MARLYDEKQRLAAEYACLRIEQERLKACDDLEQWRQHVHALVEYQARAESFQRSTGRKFVLGKHGR